MRLKLYPFSIPKSFYSTFIFCCLFLVLKSFNKDDSNLFSHKNETTISFDENDSRALSFTTFKKLVNAGVGLDELKPFSVITNNSNELKELNSYKSMFNCAAVTSHNNSTCTLTQWCHEVSASGLFYNMGNVPPGGSASVLPSASTAHVFLSDPNAPTNDPSQAFYYSNGVTTGNCNQTYSHTSTVCPQSMCNPSLTINNNGFCPVQIYWWKSSGDEYYTTIQPGNSWSINTYDGYKWRAINTNHDWSNLLFDEDYMITGCDAQTWDINPTYCDPCEGTPCDYQCDLNDWGTDGSTSGTRLLWIKLPGESTPVSRYSVVNNSSSIIENADGTALISGTAGNIGDPSFQWQYNVKLINKRNWTEWSALGRDYKPGVSGSDHTTWTYYEVDNSNSYFTGLGGNSGKSLTITHNPGDYEFGFQIGNGANVKNADYGLSGWFKISGSYTGHGDFNGNLENCGDTEICEDVSTPEINAPVDITVECTDSIDPADIGEASLNCVSVSSYPIVEWDLDACTSYSSNGTNLDFSEFTPTYPTALSCGNVSATNVTRNYGEGHSCTYPRAGAAGEAMCVSAKNSSSFNDNDDKAIRFSVTLDPTETTHLTGLNFWELAPFEYSWLDGPSGTNNYPTKYGIRVLKDGTEIFKDIDIPATNTWTLETFDFSGNDDFKISATTTFSFELLGYDLVGNGAYVAAWDIDDVQIEGGCSSSVLNSNITFTDVESGDCPKIITRTFEYTYETSTNSTSCEDENIVRYTMDECNDDGNYNSLGEFHADYPNDGGFSNVSATGFTSGEDQHSCTPGPQGVSGMCIPAHPYCSFDDDDDDILMLSVTLSPQNGDTGIISKLEFFEKAPLYAEYTYSNYNPLNNYPTKYGVRILKDGTEVYSSYEIPTTLDWTLESFDFSNDTNFSFTTNTTFEFHLIGYCTIGNGGSAQAWDLDDLKIYGGNCSTTTSLTTETITAIQTITVEDNNAPTFTNLPADLTVNCEDDPAVIAPDFSDACDDDLDIVYEEEVQQGNCEDNYSILRKWTATDDCGNSTTATQLVTFSDTSDPVFSNLPGNMAAECDAIPPPATLTATDNCDTDVSISFVETRIDGSCQDNYQLERVWTAVDNCGNTFSHTQIITISDITAPVFEPLADVTLECSDDLNASTPVANDNCDTDVHIFLSNEFTSAGSCTDNYTITRIWTATDNCGNQSTLTQVTTVQDSQVPTIVCPSDETVSCDAIPGVPTPTVNDNCDNDVTVNFNEAYVPGSCDNSFTIIRTWVAEDNCGNSATVTQTITVIDSEGPEILAVPANVTVECNEYTSAPILLIEDNCDANPTIELHEVVQQGVCEDNYIVIRTWTATDACGNTTTASQEITVTDTTSPELVGIPANETVECDAIPPAATPTASDNCDTDVTIDLQEVITDGNCTDNYTLTRTWTAIDNCGNTDVQVQIITVQDTTDPELFGVPSDASVECDAIPIAAIPTATDNCDTNVDIEFEVEIVPGTCPDSYLIIRKWTASDNCGNQDVQIQNILVQDTTDPILIGVPVNVTVECNAIPTVATPMSEDNCDPNPTITFSEVKIDGTCVDSYTLERTWTTTDACGNDYFETQIITVQDTTDPILYGVPADITVECDLVPSPAALEANDNCDTYVEITFTEVRTDGNCEDNYTLTRTWTATDNCGNTITGVQIITVQDTTDPVLYGVPSNITVECDAIPLPALPTATDNCDADVDVSFVENTTPGVCIDNYTITRIWTATDNCGNAVSGTQMITVQDTTDPILVGVPGNVTVECDAIPAPVQLTATDNCATDVSIDYLEVRTDGTCEDTYTLTRTWTASDNCGNTEVQVQIIEVQDTTDPILVGIPGNVTVECDAVPTTVQPTATDNCDVDVTITYNENIVDGSCVDNYTITRTWTATDNCGNTVSGTQIITVQDTTDPIISGVPADITVECNTVPAPVQPLAMDNCATDVEVTFSEIQNPLSCGYELIRTWTATDNCGNSTSATQTITVEDNEDPVLIGVPVDATAECDDIPPVAANITVTDNCSTNVTIDFTETTTPGACTNAYTIIRTWTATDDCGNTASISQNIEVEDYTPPTIIDVPANTTVECSSIPGAPYVGATDNCDYDVEAILTEVETPLACGYLITRTWSATDDCGNESTAIQEVTVTDSEAPSLWEIPADLQVECGNIPSIDPNVGVLDNCDPNATLYFIETYISGSCSDNYTIVRTWTATDNCGNTVSDSQYITVSDTQDPIIVGVPADVTVGCDAVPAPAMPTATDNCDNDVDLNFNEISVVDGCGYILTRTWTATDNCGNTVSVEQTITVNADTPVLSDTPADITVECNNIPVPANVTGNSNCDPNIVVWFMENIIPGSCADSYTIERIWTIDLACGNDVSHTQLITVVDTQLPILVGVPVDLNVGCGSVPVPNQPVATDNCDTDVDVTFSEIQNPLSCGYELVRTWTATDNCGNTTSASQTITVEDNEDPVLIGVPVDTTADCNNIPIVAANITVTDNCTSNVIIDFTETTIPGACTNSYTLIRTWTATDDCGNTASISQNIEVEDNTPPTIIDVPVNTTVECSSIPGAPYVGATDNCDYDVEAILTEVETPLACGYLITRTWTATDDCGNESTATQEVTVTDSEAPSLWEIPADIQVECGNIPPVDPNVGVLDNCDPNATLDFTEISIPGFCTDNYTILRTWTATDNCGNSVSDSQYIVVEDTQAPVLTGIPVDITVDCNNIPMPAQPVGTDNCDLDVEIDLTEVSVSNGCGYILTRTWTATDNCGNVTEGSQMITVNADTPILSDTPGYVTVECSDIPTAAIVTAESTCAGIVQVDFIENIIPGICENSYTIERTWSIPSGCGSAVSHTQLITVEDTQSPILVGIPADLNVDCGNVPAPAQPDATDNCDTDVEISFNEIQNPLSCGYELVRTWTATDNCGNETSVSQTITVQDNEAPILIGVPDDEVVNCGTIPNPAIVTANDNCDNDVEVIFSEALVVNGCQTIITRTWSAIDDCGNETSNSQTITINSDPATLSAMPSDFIVECSNVPDPANITGIDGCTGAPVPVYFVENITPGDCENSYTVERIWSVSSGCGSIVSHTQYITVEDTTDPTLLGVPTDVDVECGMIPTVPILPATDNCDADVDVSFSEIETPAACGYILTRTWTATDNCGNSVSASQNIHIGDNTPPVVVGIPSDLTVECDNIPAVTNNPITTDNCDVDVEISFNETNTPGVCADSYTLTRTWAAVDDCGNLTEAIQTIFVQDVTNPTLIGVPSNLTVDLTLGQTIPTPPNVIGSDNCDTDVEITFEEIQTGSGCSYTLERTWTAADNCGNEISSTQTIEVIGGLNVTEIHVDATCGENNGSINLTVSGGIPPFEFVWSNGAGNIEDLTGLAPGTYEVTVTDDTGCSANLSIEILGTGALQADITATMVNCYEGNDGSINVTMVNGLTPFTYDWTGGIGNIPNPTNLSAGSYNVTITDANGCTVSTGANVNQPQELTLTIDSNSGGCAGALGSATANVDGGTPYYQYVWSNGETTATISDLDAGTYTVVVTDNNGCTIEDEVIISASSNIVVSIDKTDVSCYSETDGTASASATGGQPVLTYLWSNGETASDIFNLEAGVYTVTVTDGAGCTGIQSIQIISPSEIQLTTISTEVTPIGDDGTATVTATGGTLPYEYIWSNGGMTPTITALSVGTYTVTVIDDNGCFAVEQVEVNSSVPIGDVNIGDYVWFDINRDGIQDANEIGFNNVMVKLVTAGQDGTFGTVDDEIVATETTSNNPALTGAGYYLFENVLAGTYQIEFMPSSLPNDYIFTLDNEGNDDNIDSDANPLTGRTPTFTVVAGQMDDLSFDAGIHPECNNVITGGAIAETQTICAGDTPDLIVNTILPMGGGGDLEYIWLMNTTGSPFSSNDPSWTIIQGSTDEFYQPGQIYQNTYFVRCARREGCMDYIGETNIVAILVTPLPTINIQQAPTSLCVDEEGSFQAVYAGATATYLWEFGDGASPQTSTQRNVYNVTYNSVGIKTVTLTVENMGCSISITYELEVINCLNNFEFTNFSAVATPNGTEVLINWTTRFEMNESRFYLEHSKNGDDFQTFELRNANGSAQEYNSYQAVHADPYYGVNHYRIKYIDGNGEITYSRVEVVVFDNGTRDIHVHPNPVIDFTYVEFLTELTEDATIEVVDMAGRVLSSQIAEEGFKTYRVSLADFPAGTYLIWVRYNDYRKDVERVVKITE